MLRLTIRDLMLIKAIAESSNLKMAAGILNISPSALTHRIKRTEKLIEARLFDRHRGILVLTRAGNVLLRAAQICLRELDNAERTLVSDHLGLISTVNIGTSTLSGLQWLPDYLLQLSEEHPEVDLQVGLDAADDPVQALRNRSIDIAIMPLRVRLATLRNVFMFKDEMMAILAAHHPKAKRKYLEPEDFSDETYIGFRPGRERGREYERFFEPTSTTPKRLMPGRSTETIIALVRAGIGITIMTRWSARHYLSLYDLCAVPLTRRGLAISWHAILRSDEPESSPVGLVAGSMARFLAQDAARDAEPGRN